MENFIHTFHRPKLNENGRHANIDFINISITSSYMHLTTTKLISKFVNFASHVREHKIRVNLSVQ